MKLLRLRNVDRAITNQIGVLVQQLSKRYPNPSAKLLQRIVKNPDYELWVMRDGKHIIGMGTLIVVSMTIGVSALLEDIVVDERYQGKGLGKAIIKKLITRAQAHKAQHIDFTSNPKRTSAHSLYLKFGFEQRDTNVYRLKL